MKKNYFTLLILLVLSVTIAGAYATWSYTSAKNVDAIDKNIAVNLAEDDVQTADGGTLTATGTLAATIDDVGGYKAGLTWSGDGFTVTYDATGSSTPDITAINMQATVTVTSKQYNGADIMTVKTATIYSTGAVSTWTITSADIAACLELADITLPTHADYNAFKTALDGMQITVTIAGTT